MITLEILEQLTPEQIKALSFEEKREALAILDALEISRLERMTSKAERSDGAAVAVETPAEPLAAQPAEQEQLKAKPGPIPATPPVLTPAERAREESERVQAEAEQFQRTDFLTQLCGTGSAKASGKANWRWNA